MISPKELLTIALTIFDIVTPDFVLLCPEYDMEELLVDQNLLQNWKIILSAEELLKTIPCGYKNTKCLVLCSDALQNIYGNNVSGHLNTNNIRSERRRGGKESCGACI